MAMLCLRRTKIDEVAFWKISVTSDDDRKDAQKHALGLTFSTFFPILKHVDSFLKHLVQWQCKILQGWLTGPKNLNLDPNAWMTPITKKVYALLQEATEGPVQSAT
eukprot:1160634-Pelagomonas_calceolata.AAC.9